MYSKTVTRQPSPAGLPSSSNRKGVNVVKKVITATLLLVGVLFGLYLTGMGIVLQRYGQSLLKFAHHPTTSSYLWWGVSALGIALIVACVWGGIRFFRRPNKAHVR
ncbi:Uncharacterised protein [Mycobacteroides abscessus subsp. abscessus]|nr:Uncharacterised protein [Mycobacteroides abscessus subsp. abscessus]SLI35357.1 Uncharacterised protein [Mycobacteroides abscessus subsp. abscessus]